MGGKRSSIAFFSTYRPPVPLDIFSSEAGPQPPPTPAVEIPMTDGKSYNYNGRTVPPAALKAILNRPKLASSYVYTETDLSSGRISGTMFISERNQNLETLHLAISFGSELKVFEFAEIYDMPKDEVRMEDSPCFAGEYLVFISTKEPAIERRQPWTAVFRTNLITGKTDRLTPREEADLSPSVSPSGKKIAVASFEGKGGWDGEIKDLKTDIYVMDLDDPSERILVVENGGWPTWGSDDVIYFHRKDNNDFWGVYRADISDAYSSGFPISEDEAARITPEGLNAMTPAAIDFETVAVAIIRKFSCISRAKEGRGCEEYRHIEIFEDSSTPKQKQPTVRKLTELIMPKADHFNPFVIDGGKRAIGYHRCRINEHLMNGGNIERKFHEIKSPLKDVEVLRAPGAFPSFTKDGSKLAFVDNEFKAVWVADSQGLRVVFNAPDEDSVFSTVWNQKTELDTLYVCMGPSFKAKEELHIHAIPNVGKRKKIQIPLTEGDSNNAFPSSNADGTMIVFRSTRNGGPERHKSLYLMDSYGRNVRRLTTRDDCTDTHCQWSPSNDWIVFSSDRDKPSGAPKSDNNLDPGYFSIFLVKWNDPNVIVRVMQSGRDIAGHVNHPVFNPDGNSIVVTADLAGVTVDPVSMPLVTHSVRPYGEIFTFDIDLSDIKKNMNIEKFHRLTHSRYENSTATWTTFSLMERRDALKLDLNGSFAPACPYVHSDGGHSWHMSGHLCIPKSCC